MTITWTQFAWAMGLFLAWNAFMVGIIKVLITREVRRFDNRLTEIDLKASNAEGSTAALTQALADTQAAFKQTLTETQATFRQALTEAHAAQRQALTESVSALRLEIGQRPLCDNHHRMEKNDTELFQTLRMLHGDLQKVIGGIESMKESTKEQITMLMQHHIDGGK